MGDLRDAPAWMVRGWFAGREAPENSFVVSAATGKPTRYPREKMHPALEMRPEILRTADELLPWLQTHPVIGR